MTYNANEAYLGNVRSFALDRRRFLRGLAAVGGLGVAGGALTACNGDEGPGGGTGGDGGGTLVVGVDSALADFDPYNHLAVNFPMMATMYSYLITYDDDYQPTPDLAEEWSIAPDQLTATITLREATFHDGSPVTADDVVAGVERALDPATGISQTATASIIEEATAADDRTVNLTFVRPTAESRFLDFMYWFPVVQAAKNSSEGLKQEAAGSGPFVLESYLPGDRLVLASNDSYYASDRPYLDKLEIRFFDNEDSLVAALRAGTVAGALALEARHVTELESDFTVVQGAPGALIALLRMNPLQPPFDNKMVRQAIARAVNRQRLVDEVQSGVGELVYTNLPPNSSAFDPAMLEEVAFDLDAAKELLDASGGQREAIATVASTDSAAVRAFQIIQEDLESIGFTLELETLDTTTVNARYLEGDIQCVIRQSSNAYANPMGVIQDSAFRLANNPLWQDQLPEAYTSAIAALDEATTDEEVVSASQQVNEVLVDESWAVGMYTVNALAAFEPSVEGYERTPADHPVFTNVTVA